MAREYLKPGAEYLMGEFTEAAVIEVLRRGALYGKTFGFDFGEGRDKLSQVIVVQHDQGPEWSDYWAGVLDETFRVLLRKEVKITRTAAFCMVQLNAQKAQGPGLATRAA